MGLEPATACLQNRCSTIELHRPRAGGSARILTETVKKEHFFGGSPGTRTPNQLIKSQLLYH